MENFYFPTKKTATPRTLEVLAGFTRPPYVVVIPTYGRPDRLVRETLGFLKRQKIPQNLIEILGLDHLT